MKNRFVALFLAGIMSASLLTGCEMPGKQAEAAVEEEIIDVDIVNPKKATIEVNSEFVGTLEYKEQTDVYPKLSGEVTEVFFKEGDYVNEGDLLFTLDDKSLQLNLDSAQAAYRNAKAGTDQQVGAIGMTINSDLNQIASAQEGISQIEGNYQYLEEQYGYLQESKEILEENLEDAKDDKHDAKKQLDKAKKALKAAKAAGADTTELKAAVSGLESAVAGYESAIDNYEMNINTYDSNQNTMAHNKSDLQYSYEQAKRGLALAQENLAYYIGIQAPAIQESAQATLAQAQVGIDSVKLQLGYTQVTAPVSGYIQTKNINVHDMAQAGYTAFVITNDGGINAVFNVPENAYRQLKLNQEVAIKRGDDEYKGKITEIPETLDDATGLFKITASVDGDVSKLMSGTNVEVYTVTDVAKDVLTIPADCVYYEGGEGFVYTEKDGIVSKVYVSTGLYDSEKIEITDGIDENTNIVTTWSSDLRNGLKVNTNNSDNEEVEE